MTEVLDAGVTDPPDLAALTGVRSGRRSYYREFQRSTERLQKTVRAMDAISLALVRTVEGPRTLIEAVLRAAAVQLEAGWMLLALVDAALPDSRPRFLALDPAGVIHDGPLRFPTQLRHELHRLRSGDSGGPDGDEAGLVSVPMTLDGQTVGGLVGLHGLDREPEPADLSVLRILANQAAVSMHGSQLYQASLAMRRRAQQLYDEASQQARDLAARTGELRAAQERLRAAERRELLHAERSRIALELHDSVAQYVLSAGLTVDICQSDLDHLPGGTDAAAQMGCAKDLIGKATEELRSAIYALQHSHGPAGAADGAGLPELLQEIASQHCPRLAVTVRIEGQPGPLGATMEHALARTAGEALFNVSMHARARKATVRLRYAADAVCLSISDDGEGDPAALRRLLRLATTTTADGRHRGLANMATRAKELGGAFTIRRSTLGGVRIEVRAPRPASPRRLPSKAMG